MTEDVNSETSAQSVDELAVGDRPVAPYLWMLCDAFAFTVMSTLAYRRDRFTWQTIAIGRSSVPFLVTGLSAMLAGGQLVVFGPKRSGCVASPAARVWSAPSSH